MVRKEDMGKQTQAYVPFKERRAAERAANITRLREGDKPKWIADPDGYGDTYIQVDPMHECKFCSAGFHQPDSLESHHHLQHPEQRWPQ